jgi:Uma2 family endonuclease
LNPTVVVEVLSPSTELYDRGKKFALYREIPALREYVLVSQSEPRVETFFRRDDGGWAFGPFSGLDAIARLLSVEVELPLAQVYEGVIFPPDGAS